ncbi:MAG: GEVED domain-containing protein, partial [Parasphingorhabdus sp.]
MSMNRDHSFRGTKFASFSAAALKLLSGFCVAALLALAPSMVSAQTTEICLGRVITVMDFRNPVRITGANLVVGSVYRFSNVTSGVDARVTIDALNNGASLSTIDRDTGLIANFQPELVGNGVRSADFTIRFYVAGTTTPVGLDFVGTGIDIDGDSGNLREYAEFSSPFAEYRLNNPTNLDVNASGPSVPGNFRFEARTPATAPGIDPTANQNIAAVFYSQTNTFRYRIGTLGTGSTTRLTSLDFSCPNLPSPTPVPVGPQDFSDAPASYGNPVHDIIAGIRMGATITAETAPYNNANANADAGDDGATISSLVQGQTGSATISVAGAAGILQGWIDWNGDGDFEDSGEQIATSVRDNQTGDTNPATGVITISFAIPLTAVTTQTFARFRWSTQTGLPPAAIIA